ncbi:MAG: hypothetical protein A3I68_05470 [Candidatus Melainabacteria bacterium RIFCSPLOWO2_02_FULL_35_15]|nr:MAG: hypothetical protein A3F80_07780 [Candidatus Melainabacteria bacterium RIFCSPLOWO2_12_FULL_35_11]OGI12894.1 MAG: hypothetical protein A3I68_05470 [Candidatus Melainabacteria bacterium RIFCSPLOWO2_02_FULL_35_15]
MIPKNIPNLFIEQANKYSEKTAVEYRLRRNQPYKSISWTHLSTIVQEVAYGLIELGVKKGDNVAILSGTRYEWSVFDLALLSIGAVVVPIYPSLPEHSVNYILNDSMSKIIILEDKGQLQKIRSQWDSVPQVRYAIVIEDLGDLPQYDPRIISFKNLKDKGKLNFAGDPDLFERHLADIRENDLASIIYTSGTTGPPKGVMLTHKNILSVISVLPEVLPMKPSDKFLSFLPLSHVFERVGGLHYAVSTAVTICYCSSIDQIGPALKDSGATIMLVVPRILEKIITKINHELEALPPFKKNLFAQAISCGRKLLELKENKKKCTFDFFINSVKYFFADKFVFSSVRKKLAPELKRFVSGGAPLAKEIAEFFCIIGIPVLEGYGLTETSAPATVNTLKQMKIGTVGKPLPNVQIKIADDGEILIKGPNVFCGYYKDEKATKDSFADNWFLTGDIGSIDNDGFLKITGRKKDIIVNSAGKNIAPQNIENAIRNSPYISNVVVIGDKKKYLSALVTLEPSSILNYAKEYNLFLDNGMESLAKEPNVIKLIDKEIKIRTAEFADYEQIRKFTVFPQDFSIESGEITPTLKIKRKFIEEKYKKIIDDMYPTE